jgi:hypothetical protein
MLPEDRIECLFAVCRDGDLVAFGLEIEPQPVGDMLLVLDNENAAHI